MNVYRRSDITLDPAHLCSLFCQESFNHQPLLFDLLV